MMTDMKRVPWTLEPADRWPGLFSVYDCDGNVIATTKIAVVAWLIAAAPELLAACSRLLSACDDQIYHGGVTGEVLTVMEEARTAIAKATE